MTEKLSRPESCDPQLLERPPAKSWDLENLGQYLRSQRDCIDRAERSLAIVYWRLGAALTYSRRHFDHGQWSHFLDDLGIERSRASKARAIFRTFRAENFLAGMSVDEAYAKRLRKPKPSKERRKSRSSSKPANPNQRFCDFCELVVSLQTSAKLMTPTTANHFLAMVRTVEEELKALRVALKSRCESAT